jgi:hypothetical protein
MGRAFAREPGRRTCPRSFSEGSHALFHKALAGALDRDATGGDLLGNLFIAESFIGFQQNAGACHLACCDFARADESQKGLSLFGC